MNKPIIALSARMGFFEGQNRIFDNQSYFDAVLAAGGIPVMVSYGEREAIQQIAQRFDGLLITGGEDLDPALFHQSRHPATQTTDPRLDELDLGLIEEFAARNKPILGICRGIQSINVCFGGTLYQDINTQVSSLRPQGHQQNKAKPGLPMNATFHDACFEPGTRLYALFGERHPVNSFHHQNIDQLAPGFTVCARSEDGLIEGIEKEGILAVQWHPERLIHDPKQLTLFQTFVAQCARG